MASFLPPSLAAASLAFSFRIFSLRCCRRFSSILRSTMFLDLASVRLVRRNSPLLSNHTSAWQLVLVVLPAFFSEAISLLLQLLNSLPELSNFRRLNHHFLRLLKKDRPDICLGRANQRPVGKNQQ